MQFITTLQKAYQLEVNATGMSVAKNQHFFFKFIKTPRHQNSVIKT